MEKENIEIRFFFGNKEVKNALNKWKKERRKFKAYSFKDFYFTKNGEIVKIRKWILPHGKIELISVKRKNGLKSEKSEYVSNLKDTVKKLKEIGYKERGIIEKKKAWLISKSKKPTYAIEFVKGLGWTGEIEVPEKDKKLIPRHIDYLKNLGAKDFSKKSLLDLFIKKNKRENKK